MYILQEIYIKKHMKISEILRLKLACARPLSIILLLLFAVLPSMIGSSYGLDPNFILRTGIEGGSPNQSNLTVQCANNPLSPQAEQKVNIVANALSGTTLQTELSVDSIEIFLDNITVPVATTKNNNSLDYTFRASTHSPIINYSCRIVDNGISVFSGWKTMRVETRAIPITYNNNSNISLDILYIADKNSYSGITDPIFLADVEKANQMLNNETIFSKNKDKINFWIAQDLGDAKGECIVESPANWDSAYSFAEVGVVLHRDNSIRDCALLGAEELFSANMAVPGRANITLVHELGHRPFGLADEYEGEGGYFVTKPYPNLFASERLCKEDELGKQRDCRTIASIEREYFTSDTVPEDLMADNLEIQMLDDRRIQWWFDCLRNENNYTNCNNVSDTDKSIVVRLNFTDLNVADFLSADVSFGEAHANIGNPPLLKVELFDNSGNEIKNFNYWHPQWAFQVNEDGREGLTILPNSEGRIVTEFDRRIAEMRVSDIYSEDGQEVVEGVQIISIDLRPTIRAFCEEFPDDPDCSLNPAVEIPPPLPPPPPPSPSPITCLAGQ